MNRTQFYLNLFINKMLYSYRYQSYLFMYDCLPVEVGLDHLRCHHYTFGTLVRYYKLITINIRVTFIFSVPDFVGTEEIDQIGQYVFIINLD